MSYKDKKYGAKVSKGARGKRNSSRDRFDKQNKYEDRESTYREPSQSRCWDNAFDWYNKIPDLIESTAKISYPYRPGMKMQTFRHPQQGVSYDFTIPGVAALHWIPSIGVSDTATSPASIAAMEMFAKVRNSFSGSIEADAPDFIIYELALSDIFGYIASLKRIYRILNVYTPANMALPNILLQQLGFTKDMADNLRTNRMNFLTMINELIHMCERFRCPAVMDIINRHYWMNDTVFADSAEASAQIYVFKQDQFYQYALLDTPDNGIKAGGLQLTSLQLISNKDIATQLYTFGRQLIDALSGSEDAYIISGYLQRAFEGYPNFTVDLLKPEDTFVLAYSEEVLQQIENSHGLYYVDASLVLNPTFTISANITQDPKSNIILSNPTVTVPSSSVINTAIAKMYYSNGPEFMNIRTQQPTVVDNVIASRLKPVLVSLALDNTTGKEAYTLTYDTGTELPLYWAYSYGGDGTSSSSFYVGQNLIEHAGIVPPTEEVLNTPLLVNVSNWDWHPTIMLYTFTSGNVVAVTPFGDIRNCTVVNGNTIKDIHRVCIYSELGAFTIT